MMEKINLNNYEAFFLDYVEGALSDKQLVELKTFLQENPHLQEALDDFEAISLKEEESATFDLKHTLVREEATGLSRVDYLLIAQAENEITAAEKEELALLVKKDNTLLEELAIYHKTKLEDNEAIIFAEKSSLVQSGKKGFVLWYYTSAAAAAILFLMLLNIGTTNEVYEPRVFSWKESPIEPEVSSVENKVIEVSLIDSGKTIMPPRKSVPLQNNVLAEAKNDPSTNDHEPIQKVDEEEGNSLAEQAADPKPKSTEEVQEEKPELMKPEEALIRDNDLLAYNGNPTSANDVKIPNEFSPIKEVAINKIKEDVLKGKTFSETIMEELEDITNDKITFETKKDDKGKTEKFAINIGKFSFSRNK